MNQAVAEMLARYRGDDLLSRERALREIIQEITLVGLWRSKFFLKAAFYGGTALRILHGLDRFSEDLDFTLYDEDLGFRWEPYHKPVIDELASYGFDVTISHKKKQNDTAINSAFLKANAYQELIRIGVGRNALSGFHPDTSLRIKVEIDTAPPVAYEVEQKHLQVPLYASVSVVTLAHLFAAKMHCAFFRAWKKRVKGRDWHDIVWFIRRGIPLPLDLLAQLMQLAGPLTVEEFRLLAEERIGYLEVDKAIADVEAFAYDKEMLADWSSDFFRHWFTQIRFTA